MPQKRSVFGFQGIMAWWLSWLERRPVTAEVVGSIPIRVANTQLCVTSIRSVVCLFIFKSKYGWVPEWPKGADCKSVVDDFDGSNPSPSISWGLSSAGRASALQAEGHRFEPCRPHIYLTRGRAVRQLIGLITQRSQVQILPPQFNKRLTGVLTGCACRDFF